MDETAEPLAMNFQESVDVAADLPDSLPPLAVDIDGTLTDDDRRLDPRIFPVCRAWPTPLVVATGKSAPYPVAFCEFLGLEPLLIAENGGVVLVGRTESLQVLGNREAAHDVLEAYRARGYGDGWGTANLVNRWRETEIAVSRDQPLEPLVEIATEYGLEVVDTGYAYHVKSPGMTKGAALETVAAGLALDPDAFVAIGDSENDVSTFERARAAVAVANADDSAKAAADHVTATAFADGFLEGVLWLCDRYGE